MRRHSLRSSQPSGASRAALKRARERESARLAAAEGKRAKARELMEKMDEMESSGSLKCLQAIDGFMRKACLRIVDLFAKMDSSGDGTVTAEELRNGLKKCGLKMKRKDVVLFVRYVDIDKTGEVGMEELEKAVRELRRFNWEKQTFSKLTSVSGAPLPLRCSDELHLWRPSKNQDGLYLVSGEDLCAGLMRMRGDGDDWLWDKWSPPPLVKSLEARSRSGSRDGSRQGNNRPGSRSSQSRPGSRGGSRPGSPGSPRGFAPNQSSIITEDGGAFTDNNARVTSPSNGLASGTMASGTMTLPPLPGAATSGGEGGSGDDESFKDNTRLKLRKELRSKVKARAFKALHIGVPVTFIR